jgi:hypothetical protein
MTITMRHLRESCDYHVVARKWLLLLTPTFMEFLSSTTSKT